MPVRFGHSPLFFNVAFVFCCVVARPRLQWLLRSSEAMPSDALTTLILKKSGGAAPACSREVDAIVAEGAQENNPDVVINNEVPEEAAAVEVGSRGSKDRKRSRDGGSSRTHHKKSKDVAKDSSKDSLNVADVMAGSSCTPIKTCKAYAEKVTLLFSFVFRYYVKCSFNICSFVLQLVRELENLALVDKDHLEVDRLRQELKDVIAAKGEVERREAELIQDKRNVDGKVLKLLVERSALITECDSITAAMKKF